MDIQFIWDLTADLIEKEAQRADLRRKHKAMVASLKGDPPEAFQEVILDDLRKGIVALNKKIKEIQENISAHSA